LVAAAGKADHFGAARRPGEKRVAGPQGEVGAVEVGPDRGAPAHRVGLERGAELALETGAGDQAVGVVPDRHGGRHLGPVGDVGAHGGEFSRMPRDQVVLRRTREAVDAVALGEEMLGEGAADAGAAAGDDEVHGLGQFRGFRAAGKGSCGGRRA
jgi:hypothetical protein